MIAKNESKVIERCINSVKHLIDYAVIVIDDNTYDTTEAVSILTLGKTCTVNVIKSKFEGFASQRNKYLEAVKGKADYCIVLDADEVLIDYGFDKSQLTLDGYNVGYVGDTDYYYPVIFKVSKPWQYEYVTHEIPVCKSDCITGVIENLKINHLHDGGARHEKYERDIRLITAELEKDPLNTRYLFYLAQSYYDTANYKNAFETYVRRAKLGGWKQEVYFSWYRAGLCQVNLGHPEASVKYFCAAQIEDFKRHESYYELGKYYNSKNQYSDAFEQLAVAKTLPYPKEPLFFYRPVFEYLVDIELAVTMYWLEMYKEAYDINQKLIDTVRMPESIFRQVVKNQEFCEQKVK